MGRCKSREVIKAIAGNNRENQPDNSTPSKSKHNEGMSASAMTQAQCENENQGGHCRHNCNRVCGDPNHLANSELCPEKKKQMEGSKWPSPYRLAPSEMKELSKEMSEQMKELLEKDLFAQALSPWELRFKFIVEIELLRIINCAFGEEEFPSPSSLFERESVQFLGHVINREGVHADPAKIKAVNNALSEGSPD
ncbi:hypothetical protein Tco_0727985 [Tanacetum coccineum]|uniref:Uncharacterized protein n=1 Tax=Tanacetum coccineum TaxID=301880 RepID=A0ABQ4YJV2_9ASTR